MRVHAGFVDIHLLLAAGKRDAISLGGSPNLHAGPVSHALRRGVDAKCASDGDAPKRADLRQRCGEDQPAGVPVQRRAQWIAA